MHTNITDNRIKAGAVLLAALVVASTIAFFGSNSGLKEVAYANGGSCANGTSMTLAEVRTAISAGKVKIAISDDETNHTASATITNNTSCSFPVSFASYQMYDQKLSTQKLFQSTPTKTLKANSSVTFNISMPTCMAQEDVYYGDAWPKLYDDNRNGTYTLASGHYMNSGHGYADAAGPFCKPVTTPKVCKLEITKSVDKTSAAPGDTVTYTINFKNTGTDWCTGGGVRLEDKIDSHLTYISGSATQSNGVTQGYDSTIPTPLYDSSTKTLTWNAHDVAPNTSGTVTWKAKVSDLPSCGTVDVPNTARITSAEYAGDTIFDANPSTWVTSNKVDTTVTKQCTPNLVISCSASASSVKTGENVTYSSNVSGGNGTYAYSWSGTDSLSGTSNNITKSYSSNGSKTATVTVTSDGKSASATCSTNVTTPPPSLQVSCTANFSSVHTGDIVTYTAHPTGGTNGYSYSWSGSDGLGGNQQTASQSYSTTGGKNATVVVTSGNQSASATCNTNVTQQYSNLYGSCSVDQDDIRVGDTATWRASASGGSGNYSYDWSGDDGLNGNDRTENKSYSSSGTKDGRVRITDSNGNSVTVNCSLNVRKEQEENLDVSCSASPSNPEIGDTVTWRASASGGGGNYDYDWSGDDGLNGNDRTENKSYDTDGTKDAKVRVTSDDGESETAHCSVKVQSKQNVTVYTDTGTTPTSQIYLSQVPYTGPMDNLKMALYVVGFLLWSGAVSYYILRRKYGTETFAVVSAKAESIKDDFTERLNSLRALRVKKAATLDPQAEARRQKDEMLRKLWDRVNS